MQEWYILIDGRKEGPFSMDELKRHARFNPDVLVWKKGFKKWVPAGKVKELKKLFKDEVKEPSAQEKEQALQLKGMQEVLTAQINPGFFGWWVIIFIIILLYSIYRLYY